MYLESTAHRAPVWLAALSLLPALFMGQTAFGQQKGEKDKGEKSRREAREPERSISKHPGYVDGSALLELADEDGTLVEVTLPGSILRVLRKAVAHEDKEIAAVLDGIDSMHALVVSVRKGELERAEREIRAQTEQLEKKGWERLARVREEDNHVYVYTLSDEDVIQGLAVFVLPREGDKDQPQLVFCNIAGRIDLERIVSLGDGLRMPGLDALKGLKKQGRGDSKSESESKDDGEDK